MKCETCQDLLIDYYYQELPAEKHRLVVNHLTSCSACALEYCRLDARLTGVRDDMIEHPNAALQQQLREQVRREFAPVWWKGLTRLLLLPVPVYQTVLLLLVLLWVWTYLFEVPHPQGEPKRPRAPSSVLLHNYDASTILSLHPRAL